MQKQIVFTEYEWRRFKILVARILCRDVKKTCDVISREDGKNIAADGREDDWWIGTVAMVMEEIEGFPNAGSNAS